VILPRTSEALYLLQRIRDEAHRFAITYHRQKRSKSMVASALDDVPGLGQTRRTALLRHFGSLAKLREATAEQIAEVPGIGAKTAAAVVAALGATAPGSAAAPLPAVDPTTGEIIETPGPAVPAGASPEAVPEAPSAAPSAASTLPKGD
jgi:excinuclease ABC subunit C